MHTAQHSKRKEAQPISSMQARRFDYFMSCKHQMANCAVWMAHLRDLPRFVISAYQRQSVRIAHFQCEEEEKCFDGIETAINEVAKEKVVCGGNIATDFEQLGQI
jgi:hypothetical protein